MIKQGQHYRITSIGEHEGSFYPPAGYGDTLIVEKEDTEGMFICTVEGKDGPGCEICISEDDIRKGFIVPVSMGIYDSETAKADEVSGCMGSKKVGFLSTEDSNKIAKKLETNPNSVPVTTPEGIDEVFAKLDGDMVKKPKHYMLFPEYELEVKDVNKRILDNIEDSGFDITLNEAGWLQQALQYLMRAHYKNGVEDYEKAIEALQFVVDSMKSRKD